MAVDLAQKTETVFAVLGADGRVIVAFAGEMAREAAREWEIDGYLVVATEATDV